jgi:hypothetical protein
MAISSLHAMSVDFQCVGHVTSMRGGKEHKSAHSARPDTSASRVCSSFSPLLSLFYFVVIQIIDRLMAFSFDM